MPTELHPLSQPAAQPSPDLSDDLRRQGIDPESVSGRWLLRLLRHGTRADDESKTNEESSI
jgi:hypothetical protein